MKINIALKEGVKVFSSSASLGDIIALNILFWQKAVWPSKGYKIGQESVSSSTYQNHRKWTKDAKQTLEN